jgi:hypothetical protein
VGVQLISPHPDTRVALAWKYQAKPLLTPTEANFHRVLQSVSDQRCHILCKPRLADFLDHGGDLTAFNKISQKHVDFLICRPDDWMPMLAIELDDASHERAAVKQRDMLVNAIFAQVSIPLVRVHVSEVQMLEALVQKLSQAWTSRLQNLAKVTRNLSGNTARMLPDRATCQRPPPSQRL